MKAYLLYDAHDFAWGRSALWNETTLVQDLELDTLYRTMAADDEYVYETVRKVLPVGLTAVDAILYRQAVLDDCIGHEAIVRELYALALEAIELERRGYYRIFSVSAGSVLHGSRELVQLFVDVLHKLRRVADEHAVQFRSRGFQRFFAMVHEELTDDYFADIASCLKELKLNSGVLISARPGRGNKGEQYVLRKPHDKDPNLLHRLFARRAPSRSFRIADRDENGARALSELESRGINLVANAVAQSADHILSFFQMLRGELAFYLGCVNLCSTLTGKGLPVCMPVPYPADERRYRVEALYDVSLALRMAHAPVGNDVDADSRDIVVVTGANQGGKSTFLRSVGITQVLLQAGVFVGAAACDASVASGIFTHYKREEDATMRSGKLDEELRRMSGIADHLRGNALFLSNESFASTNEREGSSIGRQIVDALLEHRVRIVLVTHLFTLADGLRASLAFPALFLRAQRRDDGVRTFRLIEAEPLQTSFGEDLYAQIFGAGEGDEHAVSNRSDALSRVG